MIEAIGLNSFNPSVTIKEIAKQISDRDNGVRSAALTVCTIAHQIEGDKVYKYIGRLNDKEMSYLEERIKRSAKQAAITGVKASSSAQIAKEQPPSIPNSNSMTHMRESRNTALPEATPQLNGHQFSNGHNDDRQQNSGMSGMRPKINT